MNNTLRKDADKIIENSIKAVLPDEAVKRALNDFEHPEGKLILVAAGKAAWQMAAAAQKELSHIDAGIVITKYGHVKGELEGIKCYEAGHPVPDENSFLATRKALDMVNPLGEKDTVLFLLSGGGSALFESPLIPGEELGGITKQLLACGANIVEMNTIRKRLSGVKGGRFAQAAAPAKVFSIVLSDIIGDPLDMIASGPAVPDSSTCVQALEIADRYGLELSDRARKLLGKETPKELDNVTTLVTGSVRELCAAAAKEARKLGYEPVILSETLSCEAREAGRFLASMAARCSGDEVNEGIIIPEGCEEAGKLVGVVIEKRKDTNKDTGPIASNHADVRKLAFIAGGETVVHIRGTGKGGRNQELALSAAIEIDGLPDVAVFSFGSDGTDGPTDAAGGYADGDTAAALREKGLDSKAFLDNNDSYNALKAVDGLIITGPTGTNVNDVAVVLVG